MRFTVLGGEGFVGSHLVESLARLDGECWVPGRDQLALGRPLGHVFYCVGLTVDFRERPFETVEAHAGLLSRILRDAAFDSLLYLSSTRVYSGSTRTDEGASLEVDPNRPDDLYNISKLMGESLCLSSPRPGVRIARLSNVFGPGDRSDNFLASVVRDALRGRVVLRTSTASSKDYIGVGDVASILPKIALSGRRSIYNVAAGRSTTHEALLAEIRRLTGCAVEVDPAAPTVQFPEIDCGRARDEFGFAPVDVLDSLEAFVRSLKGRLDEH